MNFSILVYEKNTGEIKQVQSASDTNVLELAKTFIPENMNYIETNSTNYSPDMYYVDLETKTIQEKGNPTSEFHTWDWSTKQWILDPENAARLIRQKRYELLQQSDWSQGLDVPENLRTAWAEYRNALRNIPQQEGFPEQVTWPTKPER